PGRPGSWLGGPAQSGKGARLVRQGLRSGGDARRSLRLDWRGSGGGADGPARSEERRVGRGWGGRAQDGRWREQRQAGEQGGWRRGGVGGVMRHGCVPESPLARDGGRAPLGLPQAARVAGWVGRLSPEKGPDLFVKAFAQVAMRDAHSALIGEGRESEQTGR